MVMGNIPKATVELILAKRVLATKVGIIRMRGLGILMGGIKRGRRIVGFNQIQFLF